MSLKYQFFLPERVCFAGADMLMTVGPFNKKIVKHGGIGNNQVKILEDTA